MLTHTLKRWKASDEDRLRQALAHAANRNFRRRLKTLKRHSGSLQELPDLAAELSALVSFRENLAARSIEESVSRLRLPKANERDRVSPEYDRPRFVLGADLLFGLHHRLFPAERMAVIGGKSEYGTTTLSAWFDVTSKNESSCSYTKADPGKLGAALMAMDKSGTRLVGWVHSHPGAGAPASFPSPTDHRQYELWASDYGSLLGLILTLDGHVRVWGCDMDAVVLSIAGTGVERKAHDLYRIEL